MKGRKAGKKLGRPTIRSPQLAERICELLADGESLRSICKRLDMPKMTTIFAWLGDDREFQQQYARAREAQAEVYATEALETARASKGQKAAGVMAHRLEFDALKWAAGKLAPKKYGDAVMVRGDSESPLETVQRVIVVPKKDAIGHSAKGTTAGKGVGADSTAG